MDDRTKSVTDAPNATETDESDPAVPIHVDFERSASPSMALVEAIAASTRSDPLDLAPLAEVIDPDALDVLLSDGDDGDLTVEFRYHGHWVRADPTGAVDICPDGGGQ